MLAHADQTGEAALELARFAHPELDSAACLGYFDTLAGLVEHPTALGLRRVIGIREGFGGNVDEYYDPDNSFLDRVIVRRRGIPITLAVVWIEVGRRAGIEVEGIGLPGHFLVRAAGSLVDPFHYGEEIGEKEAVALVAGAVGHPPSLQAAPSGELRLDPRWLVPVTGVEIVARMLRNLSGIYRARGDADALRWVTACAAAL
jgi:regulator of sirC expression with transglutaminase-like and TPR domain